MIAFKTQGQNPAKPAGMPDEWPWQDMIIEDEQQAFYEALDWSCLSADAYVLYKATYQAAYDLWYAAQPNAINRDREKYARRASATVYMRAALAAGNVDRVRRGVWTTGDLANLLEDAEITKVLWYIYALSFELAIPKIDAIANPLITSDIKNEWKALVIANLFNT